MLNANCTKMALLILFLASMDRATGAEPTVAEAQRFVPAGLARFELVLGRLQLSSDYFRIGAAHERSKIEGGRERTRAISISTFGGKPTLQFQDTGGDEEVHLIFKANQKVDIKWTVGKKLEQYKLSYHQSAQEPVRLRVEFNDGRKAHDYESRSLWHLAIDEPEAFLTYMQPCLSRLEPSLHVDRSLTTIRELMNNSVQPTDAVEVERLVAQLDAESSSERFAAMSRLESMGIAAEHELRRSLSNDLSSQQQMSIKRLLSTLQPNGSDTPMRVAVWLSGDLR